MQKKKADIIATAAYFFSKGLKGFKGFRDFKVPYRSDKAHTEGSTGRGHAAEGSQEGRQQLPEQSQK